MAQITFAKAVIGAVTKSKSEKTPHRLYLTIFDDNGQFEVSTDAISEAQAQQIKLVPVQIKATVEGSVYNRVPRLHLLQLSIEAVASPAPVK